MLCDCDLVDSHDLDVVVDDKPLYRSKIEENIVKAQKRAEVELKQRHEKKRENDKYVLRKAMDVSGKY